MRHCASVGKNVGTSCIFSRYTYRNPVSRRFRLLQEVWIFPLAPFYAVPTEQSVFSRRQSIQIKVSILRSLRRTLNDSIRAVMSGAGMQLRSIACAGNYAQPVDRARSTQAPYNSGSSSRDGKIVPRLIAQTFMRSDVTADRVFPVWARHLRKSFNSAARI